MSTVEYLHEMNIVDYKSEIETLIHGLFNKYLSLENKHLQEKDNTNNLLKDSNSKQKTLNDMIQEKKNIIDGMDQEIIGYKLREEELQNTISNLRKQIEENIKPETSENKFDMLRSQAKEISAKDKEIERLTNEIIKLKEKLIVTNNVHMVVSENKKNDENDNKDISGWSPTSSPCPKLLEEITPINLSSNVPDKNEDNSEETFTLITYRKKQYFSDSKNKIYELLDNEEIGVCIGFREKTGVNKTNGKDKYKYTIN
jgi:hypothetical protein